MTNEALTLKCRQLRRDIINMTADAASGHPGGSLSIVEMLACLYYNTMNIDPANPRWEDRDRFVLSKGHSAPALYAVLADKGFFPKEELKNFRQLHSILQGHPDAKKCPGVDASTGSLGQGISIAVGMAIGAKGCGWGMELNWEYVFEKLFGFGSGKGYPADRVVPEQNNKKILDCVRELTMNNLIDSLWAIENMGPKEGITACEHLVSRAVAAPGFRKHFFENCQCDAMRAFVEELCK